jgi:hypothetical protein
MKNYTTPRTLAESQFTCGYPQVPRQRQNTWRDILPSALLACAIGIGLAVVLFYSLSA